MDLYKKLGEQVRDLFQDLRDQEKVSRKMQLISSLAKEIGGLVFKQAEELREDIDAYLQTPQDPRLINKIKQHALRIEQETREL